MKKSLLSLAMLGILSACGGGDDTIPSNAGTPPPVTPGPGTPVTPVANPTLTGQLVDSAVANVRYVTSSGLSGNTDASGNYSYKAGDSVQFSIGKIILGEALAGPLTTPLDLVKGAVALDNAEVVKILQVLQTLDDDSDPANGIHIPDAVVARLAALASEKNIRDISDLTAGVISPAFAGSAPVLKTAATVKLHFAETLSALEAASQLAKLPGISNFVIGGGNKSCSSFNGESKSSNCSADWTTILAQDPAFAGLSKANISFDATYATPEFSFSITQANINRFAASPASLFDAGRKTAVMTALASRLAGAGGKTALSFSDFDGSKALFADGSVFWNTSTANDFDLLLASMCGTVSPGNGSDCSLSDANVATIAAATFETASDKNKVLVILRSLQTAFGKGSIKYRRDAAGNTATPNFRAEFQALKLAADGSAVTAGLTADLSPAEKAILRTAFADANPQQINCKFEARTVKFLSDKASFDIYTQFVAAAQAANGGNKPTIGVVTASTENAFGDRDINVFNLKSAGANVVYLPMEGGFRKALDANDCANTPYYYDSYANTNALGDYYNMSQVFPDLAQQQQDFCANGAASLASTLQGLSGIYFSGGDQSRHLESFVSKDANGDYSVVSPQLAILKTRFDAGELVVAGTSAGDHIQGGGIWKGKPVPMIGGGDSYGALKGGFLKGAGPVVSETTVLSYERGGLGFFKYGVLDSHFSKRTREGRLVRQTKETGMDYGFGVDENTSLVVGRPDAAGKTSFAVIGAAGVFIADVRGATASGSATGNYSIEGVKTHYLTPGDTAEIDAAGNLTVTLSPTKPLLARVEAQATVVQKQVLDYGSSNFLTLAKNTGVTGAAIGFGSTEGSADGRGDTQKAPYYSATLTRNAATVFRGLSNGRVSYSNLSLKFAPCAAACVAP